MTCPTTEAERNAKREFVARQLKIAIKTGYVPIRGCGLIPVWAAYKCLYCGEFFNQVRAEEHFGLSREEFFAINATDEVPNAQAPAADPEKAGVGFSRDAGRSV